VSTFVFVVVIVSIVVSGRCFIGWLKHRERLLAGVSRKSVAAEMDTLKRRIETLETIVTDEGWSLRDEIDRLDSEPPRAATGR
jgi:tetrahydromethanopterin S-methyltransferase subunit B